MIDKLKFLIDRCEDKPKLKSILLKVAEKIAIDHLREFPNYYTGLIKMEKSLTKKFTCPDDGECVSMDVNALDRDLKRREKLRKRGQVSGTIIKLFITLVVFGILIFIGYKYVMGA